MPAEPSDASAERPEARPATGKRAPLIVDLPPIASPLQTPVPGATPGYDLSSATKWAGGSIGGVTFGPVKVGSPDFLCRNGRCKLQISAPVGTAEALTLRTYRGENVRVDALAQASARLTILAGKANHVSPTVYGIARRLAVTVSSAQLWQGSPASSLVTVYGVDSAGTLIPSRRVVTSSGAVVDHLTIAGTGPYPFASLTGNGAYPRFSGTPFMSAIFRYDGLKSGTESIAVQSTDDPALSASRDVTINANPAGANPQIFAASALGTTATVVEFGSNATGNATPIRVLTNLTGRTPFGADDLGNFWTGYFPLAGYGTDGISRYNRSGVELGSILPFCNCFANAASIDSSQNEYAAIVNQNQGIGTCPTESSGAAVDEFAAGLYGTGARLKRTISLEEVKGLCAVPYLSADSLGDVYVGEVVGNPEFSAYANIVEYGPADPSGASAIVRTISATGPSGSTSTLGAIAGDSQGNLLEVNVPAGSGLLEYPAGSTTPRTILAGIPIAAFALDSHDTIYAEVPTSPSSFAIEVFSETSSTPIRTIGGSATQLVVPAGIAVAP